MSEKGAIASQVETNKPKLNALGVKLQRKCACGQHTVVGGECESCRKKRLKVQHWRKDKAEPALMSGMHPPSGAASVVLMQSRFGHDFSQVQLRTRQPMIQRQPQGEAAIPTETTVEPAPAQTEATPTPEPSTPEQTPAESAAETATPSETAAPGLLVADDTPDLGTGQMRKTEFLAELRTAVCAAADAELAATGRNTEGCPYLDYWFNFYGQQDAAHGERALRRYAPEAAKATSARDYIPIVAERVRQGVARWARTGEVSGVPEGVPSAVPGQPPAESSPSIQAKAHSGGARPDDDPQAIQEQLGNGRPLDSGVRSRMESAFGTNFSHVRLHNDNNAASISSNQNARAFTVGKHVAFGAGEYQPGTPLGDALIAHELAHVVQQGSANESVAPMEMGSAGYETLERDADRTAMSAVVSLWGDTQASFANITENAFPRLRSGLRLSRCNKDNEPSSSGSKKPTSTATTASCCNYETFTKSNDSYGGSPTGCRKNIKFTFKVKSGADPRKCVMVNWIQGTAKNKDGTFRKVKMFGKIVDYNFPTMRIDSLDNDPVYWSDSSSRWNYKSAGSNSYYATDSPGPTTWVDGINYDLNFKMCLHCIDDVSTTSDESGSGVKNPLKCIPWEFKAKYDASKGECSH